MIKFIKVELPEISDNIIEFYYEADTPDIAGCTIHLILPYVRGKDYSIYWNRCKLPNVKSTSWHNQYIRPHVAQSYLRLISDEAVAKMTKYLLGDKIDAVYVRQVLKKIYEAKEIK